MKPKRRKNIDEGIRWFIREYKSDPNPFIAEKIIRAYDRVGNNKEALRWSMILWKSDAFEPKYKENYLDRLWNLDQPILFLNRYHYFEGSKYISSPSKVNDLIERFNVVRADKETEEGEELGLYFPESYNSDTVLVLTYDPKIFAHHNIPYDLNTLIPRHEKIIKDMIEKRLKRKIPEYKKLYPGVTIVYYDPNWKVGSPRENWKSVEVDAYLVAIYGVNHAFELQTGIDSDAVMDDNLVPEWIQQLGPGDEVNWANDDGTMNWVIIQSIQIAENIVHITHEHGTVELFTYQLEEE